MDDQESQEPGQKVGMAKKNVKSSLDQMLKKTKKKVDHDESDSEGFEVTIKKAPKKSAPVKSVVTKPLSIAVLPEAPPVKKSLQTASKITNYFKKKVVSDVEDTEISFDEESSVASEQSSSEAEEVEVEVKKRAFAQRKAIPKVVAKAVPIIDEYDFESAMADRPKKATPLVVESDDDVVALPKPKVAKLKEFKSIQKKTEVVVLSGSDDSVPPVKRARVTKAKVRLSSESDASVSASASSASEDSFDDMDSD